MSDGVKKVIIALVALGLGGYAVYNLIGAFGEPDLVKQANTRILKDVNTGELVAEELNPELGPFPHENTKTGEMTLYPTEVCFSRSCGQTKDGTRVILNTYLGKDGPSYCPECGALVRPRNPDARKRGGAL